MIVHYDAFDRYETPMFHLCNPGSKIVNGAPTEQLGILDNTSDEELVANFNAKSELNFRTYRVDYEDEARNAVFNALFDAIENRRLLYLDGFGFFMIAECERTDSDDGIWKDVRAYSIEQELENKQMPALYGDNVDPAVIDELEYEFGDVMTSIISVLPLWSISSVDETVASKVRHLEDPGDDTNILAFMLDAMQNAYECIFLFDTTNRTISVESQDTYQIGTSIHLTRNDLVNEIKIEESSDDLYTSLVVRGSDGDISVDGINPLGTSVIYDFSHYLSWMRQSNPALANRVQSWQEAVEAAMQPGTVGNRTFYDMSVDYYQALANQLDKQADVDLYSLTVAMYTACIENIIASYMNEHTHVFLVQDAAGTIHISGKAYTYKMYTDASRENEIHAPVHNEYYYDDYTQKLYAYILNPDYPGDSSGAEWFLYPFEEEMAAADDIWQAGSLILSYDETMQETVLDSDVIVPGYYRGSQISSVQYVTNDIVRVMDIIAGDTPTQEELAKYDIDSSGQIDSDDLNQIKIAVLYNNGYLLDPNGSFYPDLNQGTQPMVCEPGKIYFDQTSGLPRAFKYDSTLQQLVIVTDVDALIAMVTVYRDEYADELATAETERDAAQAQASGYQTERQAVTQTLSIDSYFTSAQLEVLSNYIFEGTYTDEYIVFTDSMDWERRLAQMQLLYQRGRETLTKISQPTYKFSVDVENFAFQSKFAHFADQLRTGSLINVELAEGDVAALFLTAFTVNWDDATLSLTFGNRFNHYDTKSLYQNALGQIQKTANSVAYIRDVIDPLRNGTFEKMENAIASSRTLAKDNALSAKGQTVVIDDTGFSAKRSTQGGQYLPEMLKITNDSIVLTDDGWKTAKVAIGKLPDGSGGWKYGINTELLMSELIVGHDVELSGEMTVWQDDTLQRSGGSLGYANGEWIDASGTERQTTHGMIMKSTLQHGNTSATENNLYQSFVIVTDHGVRFNNEIYYPADYTGSGLPSSPTSSDLGKRYVNLADGTVYVCVSDSGGQSYFWTADNDRRSEKIDNIVYTVSSTAAMMADEEFRMSYGRFYELCSRADTTGTIRKVLTLMQTDKTVNGQNVKYGAVRFGKSDSNDTVIVDYDWVQRVNTALGI